MYLEDGVLEIEKSINVIKPHNKVVLWGLGLYAEKILKYTSLITKITKVVDNKKMSDIFFGMKIYKPYEINWSEIDVIVVTSYFRAQEIIAEIKEISEFIGQIIDLSYIWIEKPFYEFESNKRLVIDSNQQVLLKNVIFKNIGVNKRRCFILGNGPSTKEFDLSKLHNETVFAVNDFFRFNEIESINPNYYVIMDPYYIYDKRKYLKKIFEVSNDIRDIKYWFPIRFKEEIEKIDNLNLEKIFYVSGSRDITCLGDSKIDLSREIPSIQSVIHASIFMAIYMGYKEIYLLGCEETGILFTLKSYLGEDKNGYAFDKNCSETEELGEWCRKVPIDIMLAGYKDIYRNYKLVINICKQNAISLYTCSEKTLVDDIEYRSYDKIFKR